MAQPGRGRPLQPLDPGASAAARLGAEIRSRRVDGGLTLQALAARCGFSPQHVSEAERAKAPVSASFVAACDRALHAQGALLALVPAVVCERATQREERSAARHRPERREVPAAEIDALAHALSLARYADAQDASEPEADVDPVSRRSLLGVGVGAALGLNATTAPTAARELDPELVSHWLRLLHVLTRHSAMHGPGELLGPVRHQIGMIAEHRELARGRLRTELLRVESRWSDRAASLSNQTGDPRRRDAWTDHALALAREAGDADMVAELLERRGQWATVELDARGTIGFAEAALRVPGARVQTRARAAMRAALGHALAGDAAACERMLAHTAHLLARLPGDEPVRPLDDVFRYAVSAPYVRAAGARCWLALRPSKAIGRYDDALDRWPRDERCDGALHRARLAIACAAAGEPDRAAQEGAKALGIGRATGSDLIRRELARLDQRLAVFDTPSAAGFREAFAGM